MQSEVINRLRSAIEYVEADIAQDYADAETTGERPDLHDNEITLSLEDAKALEAALSAAEPVAWQWRSRIKGGAWDSWENGRYRQEVLPFMEVEERRIAYPVRTATSCDDERERKLEPVWYQNIKGMLRGVSFTDEMKMACLREFEAFYTSALSAQVQDVAGDEEWQIVPKHPTGSMIEAVVSMVDDDAPHLFLLNLYRAMLAAAPAKQEG